MARRQRIFYAFPGDPESVGETISNAIAAFKTNPEITRNSIRFRPWPDMRVGGKHLVETIIQDIDRSAVFACDLTYPNENVSFELGYAIARFKRVWISLDTSIEGAEQRYHRQYFGLIGAGYATYNNSNDIVSAFLNDMPTSSLDQTLLGDYYRQPKGLEETPTLLYVKPPLHTEAVISCDETLRQSRFGDSVTIDDPVENRSPTLDWYAGNIGFSDAVLVHLLAADQTGHLDHNVKSAFVAGLARGFGKPSLLIAKTPFDPPVDYQGLLRTHGTATECSSDVEQWIDQLSESIPARRSRRPVGITRPQRRLDLRNLSVGDFVAENERHRINDYFVETSAYFRALDDPVTIVVGRRGVGKSAQLYAMEAQLKTDKRNHVCVIKPVGYEIDGLVRVLESIIHSSERGYLIESLWKFLIYSELATSMYDSIQSRPLYQLPTGDESRLTQYYHDNRSILAPPFSERLDGAIRSLTHVGVLKDAIGQRQRISELLHAVRLRDLREILGKVLADREKVSILIDNLDAPWGIGANVEVLAELLWGLLHVSDDIVSEFQVDDHWRAPANLFVTVFLRSDIFAVIQPTAREQDKLPIERITWQDPATLKRVIDSRLAHGVLSTNHAADIWEHLFPSQVVGLPAWEFIVSTVLPRPRDVVYLVRQAIDGAVNRGHLKITSQDLVDAREKYSEYAFKSVLAEDDPRKGKLEAIIYEFAGSPKIIFRPEVERRFCSAGVCPDDHDFYIDLLCDVNFLAVQSKDGHVYSNDEADREIKRQIAIRVAKQNESHESFEVSSAFWHVLQIE